MESLIVVSTHPDDETLGCGGTLLKYKEMGKKIYWLIATSMKGAGFSGAAMLKRKHEIKTVSRAYGFDGVFDLGLPATKVDDLPKRRIIEKISVVFHKIKPDILYLPFKDDAHTDHRIIFDSAFSCAKIFRCPSLKNILMMETMSETEFSPGLQGCGFVPNYFVDITHSFERKLEIAKIYQSEFKSHPFPRSFDSLKALATIRGAQAGCKYAEGFMLLKHIE